MPNDTDEKIRILSVQLKSEVAEYELESFAGFFTYFIKYRPFVEDGALNDFESKLKDFLYLIALNATAKTRGNKHLTVGDPSISKWAADLKKIKDLYRENTIGNIDALQQSNESTKKVVHYLSFHTYFENGALCYVEQDLDRLVRVFSRYDERLIKDFGFDVNFLNILYRFSELVTAEKHRKANEFAQTPQFTEFLMTNNGANLEERIEKLPEEILIDLENYMECAHISFKFSREEYASAFPKERIDKFLDIFALNPEPDDDFLFFTQLNPLDEKPILMLPSGEFLHVYQKQIPIAVSKYLYRHLNKDSKVSDKLRKHRDKSLEIKTEEIFRRFFAKEERTHLYSNYFLERNNEQDILILLKNLALIIEIKASKYREPFRDSIKGYERLKSDFNESVQYGYEQCLRVEDKFFGDDCFGIYDRNYDKLYDVNPKKYSEVYSIVVTLERFGPIQCELNFMLEKDDDVDFPWSVYIDDLETFLLALTTKYTYPIPVFKTFLKERQTLHGRTFVTDEMDVCGAFLSNRTFFNKLATEDASATFLPDNQEIFDDLYYNGLGFKDELFIESKRKRKIRKTGKTHTWRTEW